MNGCPKQLKTFQPPWGRTLRCTVSITSGKPIRLFNHCNRCCTVPGIAVLGGNAVLEVAVFFMIVLPGIDVVGGAGCWIGPFLRLPLYLVRS